MIFFWWSLLGLNVAGYLPAARWYRRHWLPTVGKWFGNEQRDMNEVICMALAAAVFWLPALTVAALVVWPVTYNGDYRKLPGNVSVRLLRKAAGRHKPAVLTPGVLTPDAIAGAEGSGRESHQAP